MWSSSSSVHVLGEHGTWAAVLSGCPAPRPGAHARATTAHVSAEASDGDVLIRVEDSGDGFDPEAATPGFGLVGMRERVALLGGTLEVESRAGAGTIVRVAIPISRNPLSIG